MSVLRKICGITGRDRRPNSDVMEELAIEKDIVQVLQTRRPTYFGHVNRMRPCASIWSYTWSPPKGRLRKKWIDADMDISLYEATCLTADRTSQRNTVQHIGCQCAVSVLLVLASVYFHSSQASDQKSQGIQKQESQVSQVSAW